MKEKENIWKLNIYMLLLISAIALLTASLTFAATGGGSSTNTTAKLDAVAGNASGGAFTINLAGGLQVVSNYSGGSYEGRFGVFNLNHAPNQPTLNLPLNNSYPQVNYTLLNWTPTDNNNNTLRCFVYGDTTTNPTSVINFTAFGKNATAQTFNWTNLNQSTYYWRVVCSDNSMNSTSSDVFKFRIDASTPIVTNTTVFVNSTNSLRSGVPGTVFNIHVNVTDAVTNVTSVIAYIQKPDEIIVANVTLTDNDGDRVYNGTRNTTDFEIGTYLIDIVANDTAGNLVEYENRNVILLSQAATGLFINESITFPANQSVTLTITNTSLTLEIKTRENVNSTTLIVTESATNPKNTTDGVEIGGRAGVPLGKYFEIQVENATNNNLSYALITVDYTDNQLTAANLIESSLVLSKYNTSIKNWTKIEQYSLNTTSNKLTANVTSFSAFGVFGEQSQSSVPREGYGSGGGSTLNSGIANVLPEIKSFKLSIEDGKKTLTVKARDLIKFSLANQEYTFNVMAVLPKQVKYVIGKIETYKSASFINDGNSTILDLDNDGKEDVKITVKSITFLKSRYDSDIEIEFLGVAKEQVKEIIVEKPAVTEEPKKIEEPKVVQPASEEKKEAIETQQKIEEQATENKFTKLLNKAQTIGITYTNKVMNGNKLTIGITATVMLAILLVSVFVVITKSRNKPKSDSEVDSLRAKIMMKSEKKARKTPQQQAPKIINLKKDFKDSPKNKTRLHVLVLVLIFSLSMLFMSQLDSSLTGYAAYDGISSKPISVPSRYSFMFTGLGLVISLSMALYNLKYDPIAAKTRKLAKELHKSHLNHDKNMQKLNALSNEEQRLVLKKLEEIKNSK